MVATASAGGIALDTFPKYLLFNAERFGDRPALRHKDYGIWQSWSWAEQKAEIRSLALGLSTLGLARGDRIAIVGGNRPRLYWGVAAAQSLGAIPVPVYADAVADELAYVLAHAEVRFALVQDQEQVDKIMAYSGEIPSLAEIVYDEPRGLAGYDHGRLHDFVAVQARGTALLASSPEAGWRWEEAIRQASGEDISVILYTSGTTGRSKGVMVKAASAVRAAADTVAFDRLTEADDVLAYLPLAWVGDHYLNYAQGYCRRLLHELPGEPGDGRAGPARNRPDLLFRAAAHLRGAAHRRHHPHGGCQLAEAQALCLGDPHRAPPWRGAARRAAGAVVRQARLCGGRRAGLRAAEERARPVQHPRRLHGRRGDRRRPLLLSSARSASTSSSSTGRRKPSST